MLLATGSNIMSERERAEYFTADRILGKRYEFVNGSAPDFTVTALDRKKGVRCHATDGAKAWVVFSILQEAIIMGIIVESEKAPFVWGWRAGEYS